MFTEASCVFLVLMLTGLAVSLLPPRERSISFSNNLGPIPCSSPTSSLGLNTHPYPCIVRVSATFTNLILPAPLTLTFSYSNRRLYTILRLMLYHLHEMQQISHLLRLWLVALVGYIGISSQPWVPSSSTHIVALTA